VKSIYKYIIPIFFLSFPTYASCEMDVTDYVGYQIVYSGTVTGYINDEGLEEEDFEGCDFGRKLIIDYNQTVTCADYGYSYSYLPDIVILSNGSSNVACIDDDTYNLM